MITLVAAVFAAQADKLFRDRGEKVTLRVPDQWTLHAWTAGLMIRGAKVEMDLNFIESRLEPVLFMASQATAQNKWKDVTTVEESEGTIAGNKALIHVLQGSDQGVTKLARFVCFNAGHAVYCFISEIAASDRAELWPVLEQVEQSFRLASDEPAPPLTLAAQLSLPAKTSNTTAKRESPPAPPVPHATGAPAPAPAPTPSGTATEAAYRDPGGRFQVTVPSGWKAASAGEGAVISRNNTYVNVIVINGVSSTSDFVEGIAQQYREQWQNFRSLQSGAWTLAGMPGEFGMYTGTNPQGTPAVLRIVAARKAETGFLMLTSVPQSDWDSQKADLQKIEQGFSAGQESSAKQAGSTARRSFAAAPVSTSASNVPYQRYESENPAFGLIKPANWQVRHEASSDSLLISVADPPNTSVVQVYFADNREQRLDALAGLASQTRNLKAQYPDLSLSDVMTCKDKSCAVATESYTRDKVPLRVKIYFQTDAQQIAIRSYRAPASSFDAERNMLLEILANIRLGLPVKGNARGERAPAPPPVQVQLVPRRSADGSVSINLPADWDFLAGGGKAIAGLPGAGLGFIFTSFTVMPSNYGVVPPPDVLISPYRSPSAFVHTIFEKFGNRDIRVMNSNPDTATMNGCPAQIRNRCEAADITLSWVSPKGVSCLGGFKVVNGAPNVMGQWFSIVAGMWGPSNDFSRYLPMLERINQSFAINGQYSGQYIQNGLANLRRLQQQTQQSMQSLSNAVTQNQKDWEARQAIRDNSNSKWDDYMRGNSYWISEMEGGKIYRTDSSGIQDTQTGNRLEGAPYNYVHFEGENPSHPSENMRELSSYEVEHMTAAPH
jgi:hypothetical protein